MKKDILTGEMKKSLRESFRYLKEPVRLLAFTQKGVNDQFSEILLQFLTEITELEPRVKAEFHPLGGQLAGRYSVERSPTLLLEPDRYAIRFTGAPLGEEGQSFVMSILMVSSGESGLTDDALARLDRLSEKRHIRIFTSPT
jgi:thioredoxin reductase (NADPH)